MDPATQSLQPVQPIPPHCPYLADAQPVGVLVGTPVVVIEVVVVGMVVVLTGVPGVVVMVGSNRALIKSAAFIFLSRIFGNQHRNMLTFSAMA